MLVIKEKLKNVITRKFLALIRHINWSGSGGHFFKDEIRQSSDFHSVNMFVQGKCLQMQMQAWCFPFGEFYLKLRIRC